ncbi:CopD family protein [Rhizobium sp.]
MADYYTWIKAVHLISMVILVGGMLLNGFLFRNVAPTSPDAQRIYGAALAFNRYFVGTALALVWIAGLTLVWITGAHKDGWFMAKFLIVFILSGIHGAQTGKLAKLSKTPGQTVSGFMVNSGPITLVLVVLAICLVAIKPF